MLSLEEFKGTMERIKKQIELEENLNDALYKMSPDFGGFSSNTIDIIIDLLEKIMYDEDKWIEYYIYEADWGRTFKEAYESDGTPIPLETIEDLYNIIVDSNKE